MKRSGWTRNLRLKIGVMAVAVLTTLGFYGLIQANPLTHANPASSSAGTAAPVPPTANTDPAFAPAPTSSASGPADGSSFAPAPVSRRPVTRTRHS